MKLGVKVIHCSERDTQITDRPKQVDEFVNTWSIEGFREEGTTTAEMGWGTHEKQLPAAGLRARRRPAEPDLPGPDGHQHLGPLLGARLLHPRHGRPARRGVHDLRPADRLGGRPAGLPAHGPLRLLPLRRGHRLAQRAARLRLPVAAQAADHDRRDHRRGRHPRGTADGPRLQLLVDRQQPEHRGVAAAGAAPERHHHAGGDFGGGGRDVDDRESRPRRVRARRSAARLHPGDRQAVPGPVALDPVRLDAAEALRQLLRRLRPARPGLDDPWQFKNFLVDGTIEEV